MKVLCRLFGHKWCGGFFCVRCGISMYSVPVSQGGLQQ
jgi:hypothetical protein